MNAILIPVEALLYFWKHLPNSRLEMDNGFLGTCLAEEPVPLLPACAFGPSQLPLPLSSSLATSDAHFTVEKMSPTTCKKTLEQHAPIPVRAGLRALGLELRDDREEEAQGLPAPGLRDGDDLETHGERGSVIGAY